MPTRQIVHNADPFDAFNPPPDSPVIMHDPATVQGYRDAAEAARLAGPGRVYEDNIPAASADFGLPYLHVAEQVRGRKLRDLESAKDGLERELSRSVLGASGQPLTDPGRLAMRADHERALELLSAQIVQLRGLTDLALRSWAAEQGFH